MGIAMADLDLESAEPGRRGFGEERHEFAIGHVEVESARVGGDGWPRASEVSRQGKPGLLGGKVPQRNLQSLAETMERIPLVTSARALDPVDQDLRILAVETGPDMT
ncbi:hypothetical protein [Rubellimicrobium arenae]|uniref:hypothetical protein n=1 Tax=Rubellimicrobium arenae TaxID=2817372 RepID=UPI001FF0174A|nr:hypothetical protein [Rubellimicrobium arenae]